jgi:hypothetical protein
MMAAKGRCAGTHSPSRLLTAQVTCRREYGYAGERHSPLPTRVLSWLPRADFSHQALALADRPSLGQLNALVAQAHIAGHRGDQGTATQLMQHATDTFEQVGSDDQISDFAVPAWRFWTFASMLYARLGDERRVVEAQEAADRSRPATLPRFATHIELHRGLMLVRAGDKAAGVAYARAALDRLPVEKRSLSLRLMMAEITR